MIDVTDLPCVRAQLERGAAAKEMAKAVPDSVTEPPAQTAKCSDMLQAMSAGLRVNARLWRANGECTVRAEGQCTGDKEACPFRR